MDNKAFRMETIIDKGSSTRSQNVLLNPAQASDFPFWTHNSFSAWQPTTTTKISLLMSTRTLFLSSSRTVDSTQYSDPLYTSWQKHWKTVSFLPGHNARFKDLYTIPTPDLENLLAKTHLYAELGNRTRPNYHDVIRSLEESGLQLSEFGDYLNQHREDRGKDTCL